MTPDEFRATGRELLDWIAVQLERTDSPSVASVVRPGDIRSLLPATPPTAPDGLAEVIADLESLRPGLVGWQSPEFFAYFPSNTSYPAILGELVSAGLGQNGMLWATSPAVTEVETLMCDWMVDLLGLPAAFRSDSGRGGGVIQDSASSATLCAILAARERASDSNRTGVRRDLVAYATDHAHSSIRKGIRVAGIGDDFLRSVPVDEHFAMRPDALAELIEADRAAGLEPFLVIGTVGTTSTMAVDPIAEIGEICRTNGLWFHVDSAMAGIAAFAPELRWVNRGLELADSYLTNPHKWMGVTFDCTLMWVADRTALPRALGISPAYLETDHSDVIDYRDWQIPLGRRFRALKLWFTIRAVGADAIATRIRRDVANAARLAARIADDDRFEIVAPPCLGLVCFRVAGNDPDTDDARTDALFAAANHSGRMLLTRTVIDERPVIRFSIGAERTEWTHVEAAFEWLADHVPTPG